MKTTIIIPTFNERKNIEVLIPQIFGIVPDICITVVDDNSPDKTAEAVGELMKTYENLHLIERAGKEGLGKAYIAGFEEALQNPSVKAVIMMDADLSHAPEHLPAMLEAAKTATFVVGSRYVPGGNVEGWNLWRRLLSLFGNIYSNAITGLPVRDCTAGFNLIHTDLLRKVDMNTMDSSGYAFQIELKYFLAKEGAVFKEIPITFKDRVEGVSKISHSIIREGIIAPWKMIWGKGK